MVREAYHSNREETKIHPSFRCWWGHRCSSLLQQKQVSSRASEGTLSPGEGLLRSDTSWIKFHPNQQDKISHFEFSCGEGDFELVFSKLPEGPRHDSCPPSLWPLHPTVIPHTRRSPGTMGLCFKTFSECLKPYTSCFGLYIYSSDTLPPFP